MPQGKLKVKAKMPAGAKLKKTITKAKDVQKKNRPAPIRKSTNMLRSAITRAINENNETTVRDKATVDNKRMHLLPSKEVVPEGSKPKNAKVKGQGKGNKGKKTAAAIRVKTKAKPK